MSKKNVIIISVSAFVCVLVLFVVYLVLNRPELPKIGAISGNYYYVEKGIEPYAKIARPAVENYASQDKNETISERNKRLAKYFTSDSLVYQYEQKNINPFINKSSAIVTSVTLYGGEDNLTSLTVVTRTTFYSGNKSVDATQNYLVSIAKDEAGKLTVVDIGDYKQ